MDTNLKAFARTLQSNGFNVIVSRKHPFKWLYFEKDGKLGTVSESHFSGFNFATVHKPCQDHGTGYGIIQEGELTIRNANDSLAYAGWGTPKLEKYKGAEDFIQRNAWAEYYILPVGDDQ
jgi:hypothetical protein